MDFPLSQEGHKLLIFIIVKISNNEFNSFYNEVPIHIYLKNKDATWYIVGLGGEIAVDRRTGLQLKGKEKINSENLTSTNGVSKTKVVTPATGVITPTEISITIDALTSTKTMKSKKLKCLFYNLAVGDAVKSPTSISIKCTAQTDILGQDLSHCYSINQGSSDLPSECIQDVPDPDPTIQPPASNRDDSFEVISSESNCPHASSSSSYWDNLDSNSINEAIFTNCK